MQPLLLHTTVEYGMFEHYKRYPWVLEVYKYNGEDDLLRSLEEKVIAPAEAKVSVLLENSLKRKLIDLENSRNRIDAGP